MILISIYYYLRSFNVVELLAGPTDILFWLSLPNFQLVDQWEFRPIGSDSICVIGPTRQAIKIRIKNKINLIYICIPL